jgi:hypothetical protein
MIIVWRSVFSSEGSEVTYKNWQEVLAFAYKHWEEFAGYTVCSLIKLKTTATSWLPERTAVIQVSWFCFYVVMLDLFWKNLLVLDGESCSSSHELGSDSCIQLYQWTQCSMVMVDPCSAQKQNLHTSLGLTIIMLQDFLTMELISVYSWHSALYGKKLLHLTRIHLQEISSTSLLSK